MKKLCCFLFVEMRLLVGVYIYWPEHSDLMVLNDENCDVFDDEESLTTYKLSLMVLCGANRSSSWYNFWYTTSWHYNLLVHATSQSTRKLDPYPPSSRIRVWIYSTSSVVWCPGVDIAPPSWMCGEIVRSQPRSILGGRGGSWPARIGSVHSFTRCTAPEPTWCDGNADPWMLCRRSTSLCPRIGAPRSISVVDLQNLNILYVEYLLWINLVGMKIINSLP